eukprot:jgi/Galph1/294/GphlegSOOS_G5134.1
MSPLLKSFTRTKGAAVSVPIVQGSVAFWLGPEADEPIFVVLETKIYPILLDMSNFTVSKPPYEITEEGWGEFDLLIRLHFVENLENPVELVHPLRLFPNPPKEPSVDEPVVSEYYDEIVFQDPTEELLALLRMGAQRTIVSPLSSYFHDFIGDEERDLENIRASREVIRSKTSLLHDRMKQLDEEKTRLSEQLSRLGGNI